MKKITTETMEKLAKHIEKCTGYDVRVFDKAECGSYTDENWRLIHTIFDVIQVKSFDDKKTLYLSPFGGDIQILENVPHRGYKIVEIIDSDLNGYNQSQLFTVITMTVDRLLRA